MNTRPVVVARNGLVTSGHPLASQAGLRVLQDGGNAIDAAVAASAVLAVVRPFATGIGGDMFALIYEAGERRVYALNASGPAPLRASIDEFVGRGLHVIPERGPLAIETPGCVSGWDAAVSRFGRWRLGDLLQPAIEYAENGFGASQALVDAVGTGLAQVGDQPGWREQYAPDGKPPSLGQLVCYPNLARSLRAIALDGAEEFYRGALARRIVRGLGAAGCLLESEDLAACDAEILKPIVGRYRGLTIYEQPPVSQGIILLLQLAILDGFDIGGMGHLSADAIHLMVEAKKLAFASRLEQFADPADHSNPLDQVLDPSFVDRCRAQIDPRRAADGMTVPSLAVAGGDTTFLATADREGNVVSMIQSLFSSWGSGVVAGDTGILMTNRLCAFFLDPKRANSLAPGRRTMHTLNSYMVCKSDRPYLAGGTPGTDDQVQINMQMISAILDHGLDLQAGHDAPRWGSRPGTAPWQFPYDSPAALRIEEPLQAVVGGALEDRGHRLEIAPAWSIGSSKAIMIDPAGGSLLGAADRRREGYAVGW